MVDSLPQSSVSLSSIKKRADFLHVQKMGRKWIAKAFIVQVCENEGLGQRFGLVVTKKLHKLAVDRNRVKRRLRAVAAETLPENAENNFDYVFIARHDTISMPYETLKKEMLWCIKRLDLKHENHS